MCVPVIRAFRKQYPSIKITVLTKAGFASIFENIEGVNFLKADFKKKHKGIIGLYRLSQLIKKERVDAVADLHNVLRTKILKTLCLGTPFKQLDKGRKEKKALIDGEVFQQLKTTFQRYVEVFKELGFPLDISKPEFPPRSVLNPALISSLGRNSKKWIGVAPFAAHQGKMYPLDLMEVVIETLSENYKIILFGGGKSEIDLLNDLASKYEDVVSVAGKHQLAEELDIISNLDVMISMDSGNAHLAAMMGIEVITLWGVTHPYAGFYPFNQDINNALLADRTKFPKIPTSIYGNKYPEGYEVSMRTIPPSKIIAKVEKVLGS